MNSGYVKCADQLYGPFDNGNTFSVKSPPSTPFTCHAADESGSLIGPLFEVDASCDSGRYLNLADVLGGGLLSMCGYSCVNEAPQNCLVDVTWDIENGNNGRGPENITSVDLPIGGGKVTNNKPNKIVETVNFGSPYVPRMLAFGRTFVLKHPSQADFCGPDVR
jgi:hypothetical protein